MYFLRLNFPITLNLTYILKNWLTDNAKKNTCGTQSKSEIAQAVPIMMFERLGVHVQFDKG